jgi:hypothetical protein
MVTVARELKYCSWDSKQQTKTILFTARSRIFHSYGDVTIAGEGLQI